MPRRLTDGLVPVGEVLPGLKLPQVSPARSRSSGTCSKRWCRHAGLPEPGAFRSARTPLVAGAIDLAPVEVNRSNRPAMPYSHIELWFAQVVPGPVVIGSGRQRGFGLCVPVDD